MEPSYITGFVDGEGCFSISFNYRKALKTGIEIRPSFSISQNVRNLSTLEEIQKYFGVGKIRFSKSDNTYKYEVRSLADLCKVIIPHFVRYPLRTSKKFDFDTFCRICSQMNAKRTDQLSNLRSIIEQTYLMNPSGKRKLKQEELLRHMSKMKI